MNEGALVEGMRAALIDVQRSKNLEMLIADLFVEAAVSIAPTPTAQIVLLKKVQAAIEYERRSYAVEFLLQLKQRLASEFQTRNATRAERFSGPSDPQIVNPSERIDHECSPNGFPNAKENKPSARAVTDEGAERSA